METSSSNQALEWGERWFKRLWTSARKASLSISETANLQFYCFKNFSKTKIFNNLECNCPIRRKPIFIILKKQMIKLCTEKEKPWIIFTFVFYYFSYPGCTQKMDVNEQRASDKIVGNSTTSNTVEGIVCSKALSSFAQGASVIAFFSSSGHAERCSLHKGIQNRKMPHSKEIHRFELTHQFPEIGFKTVFEKYSEGWEC